MNPKAYFVTGTFHGAIVLALSEGEARRTFHHRYNGESIISMRAAHGKWLQPNPCPAEPL